ncbi:hypothetical protein EON80_01815 [bacterium]|nr:MAG: hypothetical protein EON80_01815 [bacterium]
MPTPESMRAELLRIFPDFKTQWEEDGDTFNDEAGNYSYCGLFSVFGWFFRDHFLNMKKEKIQEFCDYIETFVRDDDIHEDIDNAICTCFLEDVGGEPTTVNLPNYLGPKSLKFYLSWHGA